jgi:hypothetical protein
MPGDPGKVSVMLPDPGAFPDTNEIAELTSNDYREADFTEVHRTSPFPSRASRGSVASISDYNLALRSIREEALRNES